MNLRPLHDRVVIKRLESETKTSSGLFIPDTAKEKQSQGIVLAVGQGMLGSDHQLIPLTVEVGQTVLFGKYDGIEIKYAGQDLVILSESDILAIVG
jgi:chaperonin GroES